jgi:hypothetical protein
MIKPKLFTAAMAVTAMFATPAFAQWRSQERAAVDRNPANPATRDSIANTPSATSPRPTVIRATKGQ